MKVLKHSYTNIYAVELWGTGNLFKCIQHVGHLLNQVKQFYWVSLRSARLDVGIYPVKKLTEPLRINSLIELIVGLRGHTYFSVRFVMNTKKVSRFWMNYTNMFSMWYYLLTLEYWTGSYYDVDYQECIDKLKDFYSTVNKLK